MGNDLSVAPDDAARYWDAQAERFDEASDHGLGNSATRAAWLQLLQRVLPSPPARVADLGVGTGTLAVLLAEQGYAVCGIDLSQAMVEKAISKAHAAELEVVFAIGDVANPPLPERRFDVVLARRPVGTTRSSQGAAPMVRPVAAGWTRGFDRGSLGDRPRSPLAGGGGDGGTAGQLARCGVPHGRRSLGASSRR